MNANREQLVVRRGREKERERGWFWWKEWSSDGAGDYEDDEGEGKKEIWRQGESRGGWRGAGICQFTGLTLWANSIVSATPLLYKLTTKTKKNKKNTNFFCWEGGKRVKLHWFFGLN
jgi:hypothetical protein